MKFRRTLVYAFGASLLWSGEVLAFGGFLVRIGDLKISTRHYQPPLVLGIVCLLAAFTPIGPHGRRAVRDEWRWWYQHVVRPASTPLVRVWSYLRPALPYFPTAITMAVVGVTIANAIHRWSPPRSLWLDEETIAINIRDRSFAQLAGTLWFGQSAPYGWLVVERAAMLAGGASEQVLRLQSALCFVGTVVVAFAAGRRWLNDFGTFVFVSCCSFSAWNLHYAFEVKPYTSDAFWALVVSVVAVWAFDASDPRARQIRIRLWWIVAAFSLWFANGALLATPACAVVIVAATWRRDGLVPAIRATALGLIWLASLVICYRLSLRFTIGSRYLYDYWAWALPPAGAGFWARWAWLEQQLRPLAENPGSTTTGLLLWVVFLAGLLTARRRILAIVAAAAPLTAFALGWLRIVPLHDRVALWFTPHIYLGIALLADRAAAWADSAWRTRTWHLLMAAAAAAVGCGWIAVDLVEHYDRSLALPELANPNRGDAGAVRWLIASRQPGDVIVTTHQGWPAVWWYGDISMRDGSAQASGHLPDGTPMLQLSPSFQNECVDDLSREIKAGRRTLIYVGFPDVPPSFVSDLTQLLGPAARTRAIASFDPGRVWIVEPRPASGTSAGAAPGCMPVKLAQRW